MSELTTETVADWTLVVLELQFFFFDTRATVFAVNVFAALMGLLCQMTSHMISSCWESRDGIEQAQCAAQCSACELDLSPSMVQ